jgi:hypothetical protein
MEVLRLKGVLNQGAFISCKTEAGRLPCAFACVCPPRVENKRAIREDAIGCDSFKTMRNVTNLRECPGAARCIGGGLLRLQRARHE